MWFLFKILWEQLDRFSFDEDGSGQAQNTTENDALVDVVSYQRDIEQECYPLAGQEET
jgi:hypothetical protein